MPIQSIGDQARAFALQLATNRLKTSMSTLTEEMASGESADIATRLNGNTRVLSGIEARLSMTAQHQRSAADAAMIARGIQDLLEGARRETTELGEVLASDPFLGGGMQQRLHARQSSQVFETVVQRLNGTGAGRFLMSGLASDRPPLAPSSQMLDSLVGATAGLNTAAAIGDSISAWFDAPPGAGGFLDTAYVGTLGETQQFRVADDMAVSIMTSAAAPAVREMLKGLAMAAIADRGILPAQDPELGLLLARAGRTMLAADHAVIGEQARVGLTEQIVDRARTMNSSALSMLQLSRAEIRSADPYETAAALAEVKTQLEALHAVTARLSKLKLVDFLR